MNILSKSQIAVLKSRRLNLSKIKSEIRPFLRGVVNALLLLFLLIASNTFALEPMAATFRILGRGCDPARAAFAKTSWESQLNAIIDTATSDAQLLQSLTSGIKYDLFFIAPGQVQLIQMGRVDGNAMKTLVLEHQPHIKIIEVSDVSRAISLMSQALGPGLMKCSSASKNVKVRTEDWPFAD